MNLVLLVSLAGLAGEPVPRPLPEQVVQVESLVVVGQRLARAWANHDFGGLTLGATDVLLLLPGAAGPSALRAGQAAELLRGFTAGTQEVAVDVVVARDVDRERAYVEVQRVFTVRGTDARRAQTIYFGLRRAGSGYRLYEVRIVP
jgi:hypothetical protein